MVNWIKDWSQGVIVAIIIATILELILPNNKNKKYINSVIGVFILFSIISPVISRVTGKSIKIEEYLDQKNIKNSNYTIDNVALLENDKNIEDLYIKTLKQDITNTVTLNGYIVNYIDIEIETLSKEKYGEIKCANLNISLPQNSSINEVKEIKIDASNKETQSKSNVSSGQINIMKELIMETYGIEKGKIHIN